MKKLLKSASVLIVTLFVIMSCSKKSDPTLYCNTTTIFMSNGQNVNCNLYCDGFFIMQIPSLSLGTAEVPSGDHTLTVTTYSNTSSVIKSLNITGTNCTSYSFNY